MDEIVVRGKLKLKKTAGGKVEKKKQKAATVSPKKTEAMVAAGADAEDRDSDPGPSSNTPPPPESLRVKTKAELAFEKRQAELAAQRIQKRAQVSHRERVDKFNKYLENMTEINDIPKVSWTK